MQKQFMVQLDIFALPLISTACLQKWLSFVALLILVYIFLVGEMHLHISLKINVIGLQILPKAPQMPHFILHVLQYRRAREKRIFIFILQREGLVMIDVCLPSGTLAAQQAWNNRKSRKRSEWIRRVSEEGLSVASREGRGNWVLEPVQVCPEEYFRHSHWACITPFPWRYKAASKPALHQSLCFSLTQCMVCGKVIWWSRKPQ